MVSLVSLLLIYFSDRGTSQGANVSQATESLQKENSTLPSTGQGQDTGELTIKITCTL